MNLFKQTMVSCFLLLAVTFSAQAQDTLQITTAQIVLESSDIEGLGHLTQNELEDLDQAVLDSMFATRNFFVTTAVSVSDTSDVQTIHIRLGRTLGASDLANVAVPYNGSLPTGVVGLLKDEEELQVEFGEHANTTPLYLEVWIDDKQGNTTPIFQTEVL